MVADRIAEKRPVAIPPLEHDAALGVDFLLQILIDVDSRVLLEQGAVEVAHGGVVGLQRGDMAGDTSDPPGVHIVEVGQLWVVLVGLGRMALLTPHFDVGQIVRHHRRRVRAFGDEMTLGGMTLDAGHILGRVHVPGGGVGCAPLRAWMGDSRPGVAQIPLTLHEERVQLVDVDVATEIVLMAAQAGLGCRSDDRQRCPHGAVLIPPAPPVRTHHDLFLVHVVGGGVTDQAVDGRFFGLGRPIGRHDLAQRRLILATDVALTAPFRESGAVLQLHDLGPGGEGEGARFGTGPIDLAHGEIVSQLAVESVDVRVTPREEPVV